MSTINVLSVTHHKRESYDFHLLRENGQPAYHFVHFILPAIVRIDGVEHTTDNNACILYTPNHKQEYGSCNGDFLNDFITFQIDDPDFPARYGLPVNELFYINNGDEITRILEQITWAVADKFDQHIQEIRDGVISLLETLSKLYIDGNPNLKRMHETKQRFIKLRDEMREKPHMWTIETMAKHVWLTRSRFTVLYNEFFGTSPLADLMQIKTNYAKKLLVSTELSIAEISAMCGYKSVGYFIHLFNKNEGYTPLQYRKSNKTQE